MLNSIRRHPHTDTEDYRCSRCDTPLLRADSICPTCPSDNAEKQSYEYQSYSGMRQQTEYDYESQVAYERQKEAARQSQQAIEQDPAQIIYGEPISRYERSRYDQYNHEPRSSRKRRHGYKAPSLFQTLKKRVARWMDTQQDRLQQLPNPNEDWLASPLSMQIQWGSWQELTLAMLWILAGLGLIIGTLRLYALDGFQAMVLFQFSGLVFLGTSAYRKIQNIEKIQRRLLLNQEPSPDEASMDRHSTLMTQENASQ
jgi:hypothetical protein